MNSIESIDLCLWNTIIFCDNHNFYEKVRARFREHHREVNVLFQRVYVETSIDCRAYRVNPLYSTHQQINVTPKKIYRLLYLFALCVTPNTFLPPFRRRSADYSQLHSDSFGNFNNFLKRMALYLYLWKQKLVCENAKNNCAVVMKHK